MNTNSFVDLNILRRSLKVDVSDHFPFFFVDESSQIDSSRKETFVTSVLSGKNLEEFKRLFREVNWTLQNVNHAYNRFLEILTGLYNIAFSKRKLKIKQKTLNSPSIRKGLQKFK